MSSELNQILEEAKRGSIGERVDSLADIIEDMMQIVLKLPDVFDQIMNGVNERIVGLERKVESIQEIQAQLLKDEKGSQPPPGPPEEFQSQQAKQERFKQASASTKTQIVRELKELFKKRK